MAQSRFSAFLQRVRLLITGQSVQERREELGHQFSTDAAPAGRLGHEFALGTTTTTILEHTFTVPGILLISGLNHQFTIDQIDTASVLIQQFNISGLDKEIVLGHTFAVPFNATSGLSHEFTGGLAAFSGLCHEFDVAQISTIFKLEHQFEINELNKTTTLGQTYGVALETTSGLFHAFAVTQIGILELSHEFNTLFINSGSNLGHEINVDFIDTTATLAHSFGMETSGVSILANIFGVNSEPVSSGLFHQFNIYGIITTSGLQHGFNVPEISGQDASLAQEFGLELTTSGLIFHQFTLAYDVTSALSHEFNIDTISKTASIGHEFQMNADNVHFGHSFSAIGVAQITAVVGHEFTNTYSLPSNIIQHQFRLVFSLPLPPETTHSGDINYIFDESNNGQANGLNKISHSGVRAYSYSDITYSSPTSSGTWTGIDPNTVILDVASDLSEGDFFHGTFMFHNETHSTSSGSITTIPELSSDLIFLRQSWNSPVTISGAGSFWNINDFPIRIAATITAGDNPFGSFFGRQLTISGLTSEKFGLFDPALQLDFDLQDQNGDPFKFHGYITNGEIRFPLEREFLISGIYVSRSNGTPGSFLRRSDTIVRLGFTSYEQDYQPEELSWNLGINTTPEVFTYTQSTDQWVVSGLFRNFTISGLNNGDLIRGRIQAFSPAYNTAYSGILPPNLLEMSSIDRVSLWGGGILVWPDIDEIYSTLDILYTVSGIDRDRIPALLTFKHADINAQPKIVRMFRQGENILNAEVFEPPTNAAHDDQFGTLKIVTDLESTIAVDNQIGHHAFTLYQRKEKNKLPKIILTDEESD